MRDLSTTSPLGERMFQQQLNRRDFLWLIGACAGSAAITGCAVDPITGSSSFIMMSPQEEIAVDRQHAPLQFSSDFGISQDKALNNYLSGVGKAMGKRSHRPEMPYNFQAVNANYINAYAFPGGSIAVTRGILLDLDSEDELAALLGHELGHVNARHAAKQQSKGMLAQLGVAALSVAASSQGQWAGDLASNVGSIASGALLSSYSRDNEREADALGIEYLHRAGYNPNGMNDLMAMLNQESRSNPSAIELMFATHPMSSERVANVASAINGGVYKSATGKAKQVQRYKDNTARLRQLQPAIKLQQQAETQLAKKNLDGALSPLKKSLTKAPDDYTGLVLTGRVLMMKEQPKEAQPYLEKATKVYPQEAQAHQLLGMTALSAKNPERAFEAFNAYDKLMPGNPTTTFFMGLSQEGMQHKEQAADYYRRFLGKVQKGEMATHAYSRLKQWGYAR